MKRAIKNISIILIILTTFIGCNNGKIKKQTKDSIFYVSSLDSKELFALSSKGKKTKIGEDISKVMYSEVLNKYIVKDKNNKLFTIDKDDNKTDIDTFVSYIDDIKQDSTIIYYINEDLELYQKEKDTSKRIAKEVKSYKYLDKNTITYLSKYDDLYIKKEDKESFKIAANTSSFKFNKDLNKVIYISGEELYLQDITKDSKDKVINERVHTLEAEFINNKDLVYIINNTNLEVGGKLYYKVNGNEPVELASTVISMKVCPNEKGIYYLEPKGKMYFRDFKSKESVEVCQNVRFLHNVAKNEVYIIDMDGNFKKANKSGQVEELVKGVIDSAPYKDSIVVKTSENKLFISKEEIADNIETFAVNGEDIIYLKTDGQVFVKKYKENPKLIIEDCKSYMDISFMNSKMYTNLLTLKELTGDWIGGYNETFIFSFTEDTYSELTPYIFNKYSAAVEKSKYNEIDIYLNGIKEQARSFKKIDNNTIDYCGMKFKRIDKKTYDSKILDYKQFMKDGKLVPTN